MSNVKVCVRFRPLNSREKKVPDESICFRRFDEEAFVFKDERDEDITFCFDRVFYQDAEQADLYEYLARAIVEDTANGINGTIITYGQTGAGKTYSLEGPGIINCSDKNKGLLPRAINGLFECLKTSTYFVSYSVKLSMVEIYRERIRDLLDPSKDNLQIREGKLQGVYLSEVTEVPILDPTDALKYISQGLANKAVGATQMNMASSRSHCVYTLSVEEPVIDGRVRAGKLMLVDLAGSEKVEKTGAEGKVLEEAKAINKSLSALGNVINGLTNGKVNHIPYRSSKLTRILQDALGGNSRTALLCCCSPAASNAIESMSTLRFGTRAKLIKTQPRAHAELETCDSPPFSEITFESQNLNMDQDNQIVEEVSSDSITSKHAETETLMEPKSRSTKKAQCVRTSRTMRKAQRVGVKEDKTALMKLHIVNCAALCLVYAGVVIAAALVVA